jgi:hypothetical protein
MTVVYRIRLKHFIDVELDGLYQEAENLGVAMGKLFTEAKRSQLRNLESVAAAATRTSALKNHVKTQTGKDRLRYEQNQTWARKEKEGDVSLGVQTLHLLERLDGRAAGIVKKLAIDGSDDEQSELARIVEIELQRGVVQTAVCAALYGEPEAQP